MRDRVLSLFRALHQRDPGARLGSVVDSVLGRGAGDPRERFARLSDGELSDVADAIDERLALMEMADGEGLGGTGADVGAAGRGEQCNPPLTGLLLLVDAPNLAWRHYHASAAVMADASTADHVRSAVRAVVGTVRSLALKHDATHVVIAFDAGDGGRAELLPSYKAARAEHPPGTETMLDLAQDALRDAGLAVAVVEGYEADDTIAAYTRAAVARGLEVAIVSGDKDLRQLVGDRVWVVGPKGERIGAAEVEAKFGVGPAQIGDWLALAGDGSDNIQGVRGIGPKTAVDLLRKHGDLEAVLAAAPEMKGARGRLLVEQAEAARVARQVVALRDDLALPVRIEETRVW